MPGGMDLEGSDQASSCLKASVECESIVSQRSLSYFQIPVIVGKFSSQQVDVCLFSTAAHYSSSACWGQTEQLSSFLHMIASWNSFRVGLARKSVTLNRTEGLAGDSREQASCVSVIRQGFLLHTG